MPQFRGERVQKSRIVRRIVSLWGSMEPKIHEIRFAARFTRTWHASRVGGDASDLELLQQVISAVIEPGNVAWLQDNFALVTLAKPRQEFIYNAVLKLKAWR